MKYRVILTKLSVTIVISYTTLREKYEITKKSEWKIYKNIAKEKKTNFHLYISCIVRKNYTNAGKYVTVSF